MDYTYSSFENTGHFATDDLLTLMYIYGPLKTSVKAETLVEFEICDR